MMGDDAPIPPGAVYAPVLTRNRIDVGAWARLLGVALACMVVLVLTMWGVGAVMEHWWNPFIFAVPTLILAGLVFVAYSLHRWALELRRRDGRVILGYLDMAVRLNLPLAPFLTAAAHSERGRRARQLRHVQQFISAGLPLSMALVDAIDIPDDTVMRLEAAEPLGQLPQALALSQELERSAKRDQEAQPDDWLFRVYPIFLLFMLWCLGTYLLVFVAPKFHEIFKDYRTTLPPLTRWVMSVSSVVSEDPVITTILCILFVAPVGLLFSSSFNSVCFPRWPLASFRLPLRWIAWRLPVLHALERDHSMAEICALLADSQRNGVPLPTALHQAQYLPINGALSRRLAAFRASLIAGEVPTDASRNANMPEFFTGMLACAPRRPPDADLFSFLHRYYRNRLSRTAMLLRGAAEPVIVLAFATLVGTAVLAIFLPLVKLIQSVSGGSDGGVL